MNKWKEKQTERILMQCTQQKVAKLSKFFIEPFASHIYVKRLKILLLKFYIFI